MNDNYNLICICECKYFVNLIFKFLCPASEFLRILYVVFGEMTGNDIPKYHGLQAFIWHTILLIV